MPSKAETRVLKLAGTHDDERGDRGAAARARLLPAVTFGLGVAVLAGVVVTSPVGAPSGGERVVITAALGGAISHLSAASEAETGCCSF